MKQVHINKARHRIDTTSAERNELSEKRRVVSTDIENAIYNEDSLQNKRKLVF